MQVVMGSPRQRSSDHSEQNSNVINTYTSSEGSKTYIVEDAIDAIGLGWFQVKLFAVGKMISAADAMEMMMLAVLSPLVRCEWDLSDYQVAFITTVVFLGMGISSPCLGMASDKYGRKVILFIVTAYIGYFGFLTTFAPSYAWLLVLRCMVGVGMGGSSQGFSLNAEYFPSKYRAKLLIFGTIFWTLGTVFEIGLAMVVVPALGWRYLLAFSAIPVLITCLGLCFIPESARFLAAAGFIDEATEILKKAAKLNKSSLPDGSLVTSEKTPLGRPMDLLSKEYFRSTLQVWALWFGVAFTYYGMVLASAEVLRVRNAEDTSHCKCAYLTTDDYTTMLLSTLGELLSLPINWLLIDRFGRRVTGGVCYLGTAVFFVLIQLDVSLSLLTVFMFFVRAFSSATFNFVYIYSSELYPTSIRTLAMGTASFFARIGAMLTPFVAQVLLANSVATATWVYGILCLFCSICSFLLPIETLGRAMPQSLSIDPNTGATELQEADVTNPDYPTNASSLVLGEEDSVAYVTAVGSRG